MQNATLISPPLSFKFGYAVFGSGSEVTGRSLSTRLKRRRRSAGFLAFDAYFVGESGDFAFSGGAKYELGFHCGC